MPQEKANEQKQVVKEQFGKNAEHYVHSQSHAQGDDLALLIEWLIPQTEWTVLDIATGGGHVARTLAPHVNLVVATDLTRPMLEAASRANQQAGAANILYVQADAEQLPFLDESFDLVTCRIAAHHFPQPEQFIREVSRVVKPGGRFVFIDNVVPEDPELADFINRIEKMRDRSHVRCLSVKQWQELFAANSLHVAVQRERKKRFDFPQWVKRTSEGKDQEAAVETFILQAEGHMQAYLEVKIENQRVLTHQLDEWMVLCQKKGNDEHGKDV